MNIIIDDLSALNPKPNQFVAIDLEIFTNKGDEKHLHRPHTGKFACFSVCDNPETSYVFTDTKYVQPVLDKLQDCVWVMQNGKFDITHLRRWATIKPRKKYFDTMFIERILYNGLYDSFSLKSLARRWLSIELSKEEREGFEGATELTRDMIEYSAIDPAVTLQVALLQKKAMDENDRYIWTEIDRPAMWAFLDFKGFAIDVDGWRELAAQNKSKQAEIDATLPTNPRSWEKTRLYLISKGFKGLKNVQGETLEKFITKFPDTDAAEVAKRILESVKYGTMASRYGYNFVDDYLEYDNGIPVLYTDYDISRAISGRTASSDPAIGQVPVRETPIYREKFIARPGNKIIVADYSAQEPRLTAVITKDPHLTEIFRSGKDVYIESAKEVFERTITKGDPARRRMKSVFLGMEYGMSKYGLANKENISLDEAEELINKTMRIFLDVKIWIDEQKTNKKMTVTPFGRKIWLNPYLERCARIALNGPHQGGAADITKRALGIIHQSWPNSSFDGVGFYHDELVFDTPKDIAVDVARFVQDKMENTANEMVDHYIPFIAEPSIGNSWADKK